MNAKSEFALLLLACAASFAHAQPTVTDGVVTDPAGRTLYVFDKDGPEASHCSGPCLQAWPAYTAEPTAGASVAPQATRFEHDGIKHWAWKGRPLYYFVGDAKPGDRAGDGSGGVWHIVKPVKPAAAAAAAPQATPATPSAYGAY
jgi:predicted lipoprotein with Yx(FWY)xxD motif